MGGIFLGLISQLITKEVTNVKFIIKKNIEDVKDIEFLTITILWARNLGQLPC